jgi:hypothetical protein
MLTRDAPRCHVQVLQDSLPRFVSDAIVAVLRSPSGGEHTFSVTGHAVRDVGPGDHHGALVRMAWRAMRAGWT